MITKEQRLIILKALRDSYANLTSENMTEKEFDNLTNAMTIVKNCSISDVEEQSEQLSCEHPYSSLIGEEHGTPKCLKCGEYL